MNQDFTARAEKQQSSSRAVGSSENLRGSNRTLINGTYFASASAKKWGEGYIAPFVPFPTALQRTDWQIYNGLGSDINLF